jgi:uncharacterized protein (DUF2342 family)
MNGRVAAVLGGRVPSPLEHTPARFTTGRARPPSSSSAAFALLQLAKPCSYYQRGRSLFDRAVAHEGLR